MQVRKGIWKSTNISLYDEKDYRIMVSIQGDLDP